MGRVCTRFGHDDSGATAVEYGLIAALVAIAFIGGLLAAGGSVTELFEAVEAKATPALSGNG